MLTLLKMYRLRPVAALLLLLLSIAPAGAEVVTSMADCEEFFLQQTPPDIPGILEGGKILNQNRYKLICQTFKNMRRFVTLYDTENKIPVFSAYKYRAIQSNGTKREWKIEPQLENIHDNKNMRKSSKPSYNHQAANTDYTNQGYDRGHLFPCSYASTKEDKESTCTLTNAVPQEPTFNKGSWNRMEQCIKCFLDEYCTNSNGVIEAFLVTGAQPGTTYINNKVNVPSMLWSAFCCFSEKDGGKWLASAYWGKNVKDGSKNESLQAKTLEELSKELTTSNSKFEVFPGTHCPPDTTVTQLYPKLKMSCDCPTLTTSALSTATSTPLISTSTTPATNPTKTTTTKSKTATATTTTTTSTTTKKKDEDKNEKENKQEIKGNPEGGDPVPSIPGSGGLLGVLGVLLIGIFSALATYLWLKKPLQSTHIATRPPVAFW
ncbi:endonuclease domain-containing 1 protein-like isoform X1 [Anarrhichthys ocellatus]|uniref:endonuclease domain-containing 1 protein-like isoform X1 n=1 Tax=Anarrhichthys ocellatus TaxID=433405 RepID=UPI0012ECD08B|nr:endonuclease domain-containing 1 protein-like isoform X1 [Anarrhichthys ocellatus]